MYGDIKLLKDCYLKGKLTLNMENPMVSFSFPAADRVLF